MWHSDSSFREVPSFVSLMAVYEVPAEGGQTEFASARSAYDRLSDDEKIQIEDLFCSKIYFPHKKDELKLGVVAVLSIQSAYERQLLANN